LKLNIDILKPKPDRQVTKTLKPYQGLKPHSVLVVIAITLYGGDTKTLKPYQGLKRSCISQQCPFSSGTKTLKPYQGLKPEKLNLICLELPRHKNPKTL